MEARELTARFAHTMSPFSFTIYLVSEYILHRIKIFLIHIVGEADSTPKLNHICIHFPSIKLDIHKIMELYEFKPLILFIVTMWLQSWRDFTKLSTTCAALELLNILEVPQSKFPRATISCSHGYNRKQ